ncbi:hypothetical protein CC79DRAFT_79010 [Sarocladium strictum]
MAGIEGDIRRTCAPRARRERPHLTALVLKRRPDGKARGSQKPPTQSCVDVMLRPATRVFHQVFCFWLPAAPLRPTITRERNAQLLRSDAPSALFQRIADEHEQTMRSRRVQMDSSKTIGKPSLSSRRNQRNVSRGLIPVCVRLTATSADNFTGWHMSVRPVELDHRSPTPK